MRLDQDPEATPLGWALAAAGLPAARLVAVALDLVLELRLELL